MIFFIFLQFVDNYLVIFLRLVAKRIVQYSDLSTKIIHIKKF